jgi:hypothetical protein
MQEERERAGCFHPSGSEAHPAEVVESLFGMAMVVAAVEIHPGAILEIVATVLVLLQFVEEGVGTDLVLLVEMVLVLLKRVAAVLIHGIHGPSFLTLIEELLLN